VLVLLAMLLRFIFNPMEARRVALNEQLSQIKPQVVRYDRPNIDVATLTSSITSKPAIWDAIVPPPPPPPPPPEPEPNLNEMLKDIVVTRQQVGQRVKIVTPANPRGMFKGVGETVKDVVIKEITREEVIFVLQWKNKELTVTLSRK